jgi:hypothetical protein
MTLGSPRDIEKRAYEKPRLRVIELRADEVLATGCKFVGGGNALGGNPSCGILNNCLADGS